MRTPISKKVQHRLLYESQYACAVCQDRGCHIHHIDGNHGNNDEENLVVLCVRHHDEAHTKRQLSKNLNSDALRHAKREWKEAVQRKRTETATVSRQRSKFGGEDTFSVGVAWGYINHKRVAQLAQPGLLDAGDKEYFDYCYNRGIIDSKGIIIKPPNIDVANTFIHGSVYNWFEFGDDSRLHQVYSSFVDQISQSVKPVHLESPGWTKAHIRDLVHPGGFIFVEKAFYFKAINETEQNQYRRARTFRRKIAIEFFLDTRDMFGTTSMTVSFTGHKSCSALLHFKSFEESKDGRLNLHCSPIALGVGFRSPGFKSDCKFDIYSNYQTPDGP